MAFVSASGTPADAAFGCDLAGAKNWTGSVSTAWGTAGNWAGGVVPGSADHVCLPAGAAEVVFSTGTVSIQSIDARRPFKVTGGTLTTASTTQASTLKAGLTLAGGAFRSAGSRTINGTFTWTGGTLGGAGLTTLPAEDAATAAVELGSLTLSDPAAGASTKTLEGPLHNAGKITVGGAGSVYFSTGSVLTNAASIVLTTDAPIACCYGTGNRWIVNRAGAHILKKGGALTVLDVPVDNDGLVRSDVGRLELTGGTPAGATSIGTYASSSAAELALTAGDYLVGAGAKIAGPAPVQLDGGDLNGPITVVSGGRLTFLNGHLRGNGGTATVNSGGTLHVSGVGSQTVEGNLHNAGTTILDGRLYVGELAKITNAATFNVLENATMECCYGLSPHLFENTATGTITHTGAPASVALIDVPIDNDGTIHVASGRMNLSGGSGAATESTGKFKSSTGGVLAFTAGDVVVGTGGEVVGPSPVVLEGGSLSGPLSVPSAAILTWRGGSLRGGATPVVVAAGGTLNVDTTASKTLEHGLRNLGTVNLNGLLYFGELGAVVNEATFNVVENAAFECCYGTGPHTFTNTAAGVVTHTGATTSIATFRAPVDNDGVVQSNSGRMNITNTSPEGAASLGRYLAASGAVLAFPSGTQVFASPGSTGGAGQVLLAGGTFAGVWKVEAASTLTFTSGTLAGPTAGGVALITGTVNVQGTQAKTIQGSVRNDGVLRLDGLLYFGELAAVENRATFDVVGNARGDCCYGTGPHGVFNKPTGIIKKTGAAGTTATIEVPVDNDGIMRAEVGVLSLTGGTPASAVSNGSYTALTNQTLRFDGGATHFGRYGNLTGPGNVQLTAGSLDGPLTMKSGSRFSHTGGSLNGPTPTDGTTMFIQRGGSYTATTTSSKYVSGVIKNDGAFKIAGQLYAADLFTFTNLYSVELSGAARFDCCFGTAPHRMINTATGSVRKTVASSTAVFEVPLDNDGKILAIGGTLDLYGGTGDDRDSTGEYAAQLGQLVRFAGGDHYFGPGGRIVGPGQVVLLSGMVSGPFAVKSGGIFSHQGGTLQGPTADVGTATVESGGLLHITNSSAKFLEGTLTNAGSIRLDGLIYMSTLGRLVNDAAIDVVGTGALECCYGTAPHLLLNNATGVIRKAGVSTSTGLIEVALENHGLVRAVGGVLDLSGGTGSGSSTGEYSATAVTTTNLRFTGGDHLMAATGRITGPGQVTLAGAELRGPLTVKAGGTLNYVSGELQAPLDGTGRILVEPSATMKVATGSGKYFRGTLRNEGTMRWTGLGYFDAAAQISNAGLLELSEAARLGCCYGSGTKSLTNLPLGVVKVLGGTPVVEPTFDNQGKVVVEAGTVQFELPADVTTGVLREGTWHVKGALGVGSFTTNAAHLTLEGPAAALVDAAGIDITPGFKSNSGTFVVRNRALNLPIFTNNGTVSLLPAASITAPVYQQVAGITTLASTSSLVSGVTLLGGAMSGTGKIVGSLENDGSRPPVRLQPGAELDIEGSYVQRDAGILEVELTTSGANGGVGIAQRQLLGTEDAVLAGTLRVRVTDTFTPVEGSSYELGSFFSVYGQFATLDMEDLSGGLMLVPYYTPTTFGVTVQTNPAA